MNIKAAYALILAAMSLSLQAHEYSPSRAVATCNQGTTSCKLSSTGTVNLSQARSFTKTKNIFFTINDDVKGVLRLHHSKANHKDTIKGEFIMDNKSREKSYIKYSVVFKDKKGAVAKSKGELHLAQGKSQKMRFGSIVLTPEDMKNISSYDIQMVSSNKMTR